MTQNGQKPEWKHIISVLVENKPGVLARIAGLFSARGFNIDSLAVGETEDPHVSRMTIVVKGDERILEQVEKQLNKLIDVIKVADYSETPVVVRDLVLIKVSANKSTRSELIQICDIFRSKIVDVSAETMMIEVTGDEDKLEAIKSMLAPFGIKEMCRTGSIALARGTKTVSVGKEIARKG